MLDSLLNLDVKYCTSGNTEALLLTQKFGIDFVVARELGETFIITLEGIANTGEITRSGNPGYQLS